jgi:hypothetical protein
MVCAFSFSWCPVTSSTPQIMAFLFPFLYLIYICPVSQFVAFVLFYELLFVLDYLLLFGFAVSAMRINGWKDSPA